jgi:MoaA/NifB/PqqE/SkfB family radical SAM enzyme
MRLDDIGFYTMSDERAQQASVASPLWRCELVLSSRCNFHCPYCRHVGGKDQGYKDAATLVRQWAADGLKNIRFSGGEPTLHDYLPDLCALSRDCGIERIAISTNGSAPTAIYERLVGCGVNDFSVSLDACCAEDGDKMAGGIKGAFKVIIGNIRWMATHGYTTVGVVLTDDNIDTINDIIRLADSLGVSDIRIIPAAQHSTRFPEVRVDKALLARYPILRYRVLNLQAGRTVRGLADNDPRRCPMVLDDMAVNQGKHYPCIIYMREAGREIGPIGQNVRLERQHWYETHDTYSDPICRTNCLDVCIDYNRRYDATHQPITAQGLRC